MAEIEDPRNADYIQALCDDAAEKRRIADLAHILKSALYSAFV